MEVKYNLPKQQAGTSFADLGFQAFSEETNYAAGDIVIYDKKLYKFNTSHSGAWIGTDADLTSVAEIIEEKKAEWGGIEGNIADQEDLMEAYGSLETAINGKQDAITDLATIREGAALGATALQSYTESDPVFTASAAHGITSSDITNWNGKQDSISDLSSIRSGAALGTTALQSLAFPIVTQIPSDGKYQPNTLYALSLDSTARTITLVSPGSGLTPEYHLVLTIGATAPTITWPGGLKWEDNTAPAISASNIYEISILNGYAVVKDWGATS